MTQTIMEAIKRELGRDPHERNADIAHRLGTSHRYVSRVRAEMGLPRGRGEKIYVTGGNLVFLEAEAQAGNVSISEIMNAIITDARVEASKETA